MDPSPANPVTGIGTVTELVLHWNLAGSMTRTRVNRLTAALNWLKVAAKARVFGKGPCPSPYPGSKSICGLPKATRQSRSKV